MLRVVHVEEEERVEEQLMRIVDAAEATKLSRSKIYELIARGELESVVIGRARRIPVEALKEYVARLRASQGGSV